MKSKRHTPWPKRKDAEKECIRVLKFIAKVIRMKHKSGEYVIQNQECYCMDDGECCWCQMRDALTDLRYAR